MEEPGASGSRPEPSAPVTPALGDPVSFRANQSPHPIPHLLIPAGLWGAGWLGWEGRQERREGMAGWRNKQRAFKHTFFFVSLIVSSIYHALCF